MNSLPNASSFALTILLSVSFWLLVEPVKADELGTLAGFLEKHCYGCHDAEVQKAELNLEHLMRGGNPDIADAAKWETALHMIATGEMPPKKKPQPAQSERDSSVAAIEAMLIRWTASLGENPGRVTARRLNRDEYNNTIRDLVGVDFEPAGDFPRDEVGYGFDNIGDVLSLSPVLMERYLDAAEQIVEKAIVTEVPEWPPVKRPDLSEFQLLSWEENLLKLPLRGDWAATFFDGAGQRISGATLTFTPEPTVADVVVEGKRLRFTAPVDIDTVAQSLAIVAEERAAGQLIGQWSRDGESGRFTASALPGRAFSGEWQAVATLPDGRDLRQTLTLNGDELPLQGKLVSESDNRTTELSRVTVKGEALRLSYDIELENQWMDVQVLATLADDGYLRGGWILRNGDGDQAAAGDWKAQRVEPADDENNVRLMGRSIGMFREGEARLTIAVEEAGEYRIKFASYQDRAGLEDALLGLYVDGQEVERIDVPQQKPQTLSRTFSLGAGPHSIGFAYLNNYVDNQSRDRKLRGDRNLYVRDFEIAGPLGRPRPPLPASHRKVIPVQPEPGTEGLAAKAMLREFASRAYRRPARADEVERLAGLVDEVMGEGGSFGEGMRVACQAVLVSPHFLFRWEMDSEPLPGNTDVRNLNAYEIASRLSYFLWSSMPDDALFARAMDGSLLGEDVIRDQVQRMLADPRSEALVRNFAGQWLQIRNLDSLEPDAETFPEFDLALRTSMAEETFLFFNAILREERSILELLDTDFTFLNNRLASHYGLDGSALSDAFQRVTLPADSGRGGVLTQASILTITSNPRRTSPVTRGKWVLEQILGTPPPPPPPNVPQLEETREIAAEASLRERMRIHRDNPDCAGCHAKMDPIGFALENFDGIGRWRDFDGKFPIDAAVSLGNGLDVSGPNSLKEHLKNQKEYVNSFIEKMLTYALGRGIEFYDRPAIKTIQDQAAASGFKLSTIVTEIACSAPFLKRSLENTNHD